ncbi:hypothetical protein [Chitinophaga sp. CF418]|uniref:hypothetical protein n=1 Tax=Chitinophaga sp. CF418 TaxID=1855287 RepID=UPI000919A3C5|nr:hypothetical protein [Chitinophaga sp. CF418]SHN12731.1 hypothetical protein SAMN05216311_105327 [Chitinophaga sp. CF418]
MKRILLSCIGLCSLLFFASCACVPLRKYNDKRLTRYINRNLPSIHTLSDSLLVLANNNNYDYPHYTLKSQQLRNAMSALGLETSVYYKQQYPYDPCNEVPCDSVIIFKQMSILLGVREVIYDFSMNPKSYPEYLQYGNFYSFKKAAPNVYIRRRPVPMM